MDLIRADSSVISYCVYNVYILVYTYCTYIYTMIIYIMPVYMYMYVVIIMRPESALRSPNSPSVYLTVMVPAVQPACAACRPRLSPVARLHPPAGIDAPLSPRP